MADYAIHEETLVDVSNVIRKKDGTSALIDPADYAERINLMGMLEEKTVSGSIAHFDDGADAVPLKGLVVNLPASLSGVSSVSEKQTGRNLLPNKSYLVGANTLWLGDDSSPYYQPLKAGTYTVSLDTSETMTILLYENNSWIDRKYNATTATFVIDHDGSFAIQLYKSAGIPVINNWQLEIGSTAHAYEPYQAPTTYTATLGRTICGGTADIVNGTGKDENGKTTLDVTGWTYYPVSGHNTFSKIISGAIADGQGYLNGYTFEQVQYIAQQSNKCFYFYASGGNVRVSIRDDDYTSLEAWKAHIDGSELVYPKTPEDFTFDGQEIPTRLGYNAFWSEQGDTEVTYRSQGTVYQYPKGEGVSF